MKLAANLSMLFTERPLLERFAAARQAGFDAVEIQFPYEAGINDLMQAREDAGVAVVLINVPAADLLRGGEGLACVPAQQAAFRSAVSQCADYAEALGVRCINVLAGRCHEASQQDRRWGTFVDNLQYADEEFSRLAVTTTFEAINTSDMPGFLVSSAAHLWQVMSQVSSPTIKAQYDLYHMAMMGENLASDLAQHIAHIGHIQFADCPGRAEPGTGELALTDLFAQIDASDYRGFVAAEYRPAAGTEAGLAWLRALLMPGFERA